MCKASGGYAMVRTVGGRFALAHRVAYEQHNGPIPDGMEVGHLCGNPACVRPDHLEAVSHAENVRRGRATKLASADVIEIRRSPEKQQVLADRYGIGQSQVSRIQSGASWAGAQDTEASVRTDPSRPESLAQASADPRDQAQAGPSISKLAA
jgi:hypothetical protein